MSATRSWVRSLEPSSTTITVAATPSRAAISPRRRLVARDH
jgi:hypothetical protein